MIKIKRWDNEVNFSMPIWKLATNKDLECDIVSANVDGFLDYSLVSV